MRTMRWRLFTVMAAVGAASFGGLIRAEETTEQVVAKLKAKAEAVKTVRADLEMTMSIMGQTVKMDGKALIATPDKMHMTMAMDLGAMKMDQTIVSDGATVWTYQPTLKLAHKIDAAKVAAETGIEQAGQQTNDLTKPLAGLAPESVKLLRTEKTDGGEVLVFEGVPALPKMPQVPFKPAKMQVSVGAEDGLLRKSVMFDARREGNDVAGLYQCRGERRYPGRDLPVHSARGRAGNRHDRRRTEHAEGHEGERGVAPGYCDTWCKQRTADRKAGKGRDCHVTLRSDVRTAGGRSFRAAGRRVGR